MAYNEKPEWLQVAEDRDSNYTFTQSDNGTWSKKKNSNNAQETFLENNGSFSSILNSMNSLLSEVKNNNAQSNALALQESERNRQFQYDMSSTAHQREVEDLKAAGLNPILSANAGASTPSGSQASISDASSSLSGLLASAIAGMVSIANTNSNNATQTAINQKQIDLQEMLGLKNIDLSKYGLDLGLLQTQMNNATSLDVANINKQIAGMNNQTQLSVANINKQIAELNNNESWRRLVQQGDIDINKINTQGDVDILKGIFSGNGIFGEKSYVNSALATAYLLSKGIVTDPDSFKRESNNSSGRYSHHR